MLKLKEKKERFDLIQTEKKYREKHSVELCNWFDQTQTDKYQISLPVRTVN